MDKGHYISLNEGNWKKKPPFPECESCAYNIMRNERGDFYCKGLKWIPQRTHPCEFHQPEELICVYAQPYDQDEGLLSGEHLTNCHCILPSELRDINAWYGTENMKVPDAMRCTGGIDPTYQTYLKCYIPKLFMEMKNGTWMDKMRPIRWAMNKMFDGDWDGSTRDDN